jgi:phosphoribosylaminoimidazole (AIR) synthetase
MLRTFNCGIGMVLAVERGPDVDFVLTSLRSGGECPNPIVLGEIVTRESLDEPQVRVLGEIQ